MANNRLRIARQRTKCDILTPRSGRLLLRDRDPPHPCIDTEGEATCPTPSSTPPGCTIYSHTASIPTELVLVSGEYGSSTDGAVVSTDFTEQVRRAFRNLGVALAAHGLDLSHVVQLRTS